jgi:hypothetical protein
MPKASSDRPINILTWEDRYPPRYDERPLDLSRLRPCNEPQKPVEKKNGTATSGQKS